MICHEAINIEDIDPKNHYNPARAENDLSDPNDYDYQYCLLSPRMIWSIPMISIPMIMIYYCHQNSLAYNYNYWSLE